MFGPRPLPLNTTPLDRTDRRCHDGRRHCFARLLAAHFVPTVIPHNNPAAAKVPAVCAEFFEQWYIVGRPLAGLKLETVVRMAVDAFHAEGGTTVRDYQVIDGADPIWKNYNLKNGKYAGQLVSLTAAEAARLYRRIRT